MIANQSKIEKIGKLKQNLLKIKSVPFHDNRIPKEGSRFVCLSVILIYSIPKMGKNYYLQVFLEECKYIVKEKNIKDELEVSYDDSEEDASYK